MRLEPPVVGGGRLGQHPELLLPCRAERRWVPMRERVGPAEPVADKEPESRIEGAEGVAKAHAKLVAVLVQGDHVRAAVPGCERFQADSLGPPRRT